MVGGLMSANEADIEDTVTDRLLTGVSDISIATEPEREIYKELGILLDSKCGHGYKRAGACPHCRDSIIKQLKQDNKPYP